MKSLAKRLRSITGYPATPKLTGRGASYRRGLEHGARDGRSAGITEGRKQLREELTFQLGIAEGEILVGHQPEQPYMRAGILPNYRDHMVRLEDLHKVPPWYQENIRVVTFKARKQGWSSGNGDRFVWFTWEPCL